MRLDPDPSTNDLLHVFGRIGLLSFGGPATQIALMHKELVDDRSWLDEKQFLHALSFCMMLPGPEAMQLATYAGWRLRGVPGGIVAGVLFVIPGAILIAALAMAYSAFGEVPLVEAMFLGVKAAVVVIVLQALLKVSRRALGATDRWVIAGLSFVGIFAFDLPFPLIILAAAAYGFLCAEATPVEAPALHAPPPRLARTIAIWSSLWLAPILVLWAAGAAFLIDVALFFAKLAVVTFGGAYAVLAYMTQQVVVDYGWITTTQMMDGLGLAETTPGPLILVTQFVGMLAGHAQGGVPLAIAAGLLTLWVTFIPCFLWIFAGAPYIDRLARMPRLSAALSAVTAAVVGVILNLSVWFAAHVFFSDVGRYTAGQLKLLAPVPSSFDPLAALLAALAALGLLWRGWPLAGVLAMCAALAALTTAF